ncbi:hypothetical protein ACFL56_02220 [Candidatus Margulisiibacteriota bacterium]
MTKNKGVNRNMASTLFSVGRIRSIEKRLLSMDDIALLAREEDFSRFLTMLREYHYESHTDTDEHILDDALIFLESFISESISDMDLISTMRSFIVYENDISVLHTILDAISYSTYLSYVIRVFVDMYNLTLYGSKMLFAIEGYDYSSRGHIPITFFRDTSNIALAHECARKKYVPSEEQCITLLERKWIGTLHCFLRQHILSYIHDLRFVNFGAEPVWFYCIRKKIEAETIRFLYWSKKNGIDHEMLLEVLKCST